MAYNLLLPLGLIMKIVVPMAEICGWSLSDLIHCHGFISSLLIADRHSDSRRNNMSFMSYSLLIIKWFCECWVWIAMWDLARPAIGYKLNQAKNYIRSIKSSQRTTQMTIGHFIKTTDLDYITMNVKIMTIIFNISPYFFPVRSEKVASPGVLHIHR